MKILSIIGLITLLHLPAFATVRTVSNDPTRPAQFTTAMGGGNASFIAAHNASSPGDTLYVYGSPFDYGTLTISKKMVVIGAGYGPNNQFGQPTRTGQISLFRDGSTDASGSVIMGLLVSGGISCTGTLASLNITISRNRIAGAVQTYLNASNPASGWTIYNNILTYIWGSANARTANSPTNIIITNNILTSYIGSFNSNTVLIDHNIFLGINNISSLWNVIISNNIFVRSSGNLFYGEVVFCTFNNNISNQNTLGGATQYNPTNIFEATWISTGGGSNSGGGNLVGTNPLFVTVPSNDSYDITNNYRLQAGSPGKAPFSTDGSEAGIYGGSYPFPSGGNPGSGFDTSPMPPIPQVISVNIQNATIAPNGTLNVKVQGKVNN